MTEPTSDTDDTQESPQAAQIEKLVDLLETMQTRQAIRAQELVDQAACVDSTVDPLFKEETMLTAAKLAKDLRMNKSAAQFTEEALVAKAAQGNTSQPKPSKRTQGPAFRLAV